MSQRAAPHGGPLVHRLGFGVAILLVVSRVLASDDEPSRTLTD